MEFKEYNNPEENDFDVKSSLGTINKTLSAKNIYQEQLLELIGILEDVNEEELMEDYGITLQEYYAPTAETIRKVVEKTSQPSTGRGR